MENIIAIERTRCWNRNGCLFSSPQNELFAVMLPQTRKVTLGNLATALATHDPEPEEGFEDLYPAAQTAPRKVRFLNRYGKEVTTPDDNTLTSIIVEYGEDNGHDDSPVLVETYSLRVLNAAWDFVADEEFYEDDAPYTDAGILTNGEHYLYWNVVEDLDGHPVCRIHNSILMDDDSLEVQYPWTAENDALVTEALNDPATGDDWCGDSCVLITIDFHPWKDE